MKTPNPLLEPAVNAAATIGAVYQWVDRVNAAGGTTTVAGIAAAHAMINSLNSNRQRCETLVVAPLRAVLEAGEGTI